MDNSLTEGAADTTGLQEQPTGQQEQQQQSAEQTNQETNSREQSSQVNPGGSTQGSGSDGTATQQTQTGGSQTDDGLANFAKSQGIEDISQLSEREQKLLKVAHDNQKAFRERGNTGERVTDASKNLQTGERNLEYRVAEMEYERLTDKFWSDQQAKRDQSLEPVMVQILNEKKAELTPILGEEKAREYAFNLSRDLPTLYGMAQLKSGAQPGQTVDAEAIRREERESIQRQMSAGAPQAHATQGTATGAQPKVTEEWIRTEYDPRNAEHRKLVDEFYSQ